MVRRVRRPPRSKSVHAKVDPRPLRSHVSICEVGRLAPQSLERRAKEPVPVGRVARGSAWNGSGANGNRTGGLRLAEPSERRYLRKRLPSSEPREFDAPDRAPHARLEDAARAIVLRPLWGLLSDGGGESAGDRQKVRSWRRRAPLGPMQLPTPRARVLPCNARARDRLQSL